MFKVDMDIDAIVKLTQNVVRQLPFATNNAINRTAKLAVDAGQQEVVADLQVRKRFIVNRVQVLQYSRLTNLTAIVGINNKVEGAPLILSFLEDGGTKQPSKGPEIAVPLTGEIARPSFPQPVATAYRYTNLQFDQAGQGKRNTYLVPGVGIFQRVLGAGGGKRQSVQIYSFKPSVPLPKHLKVREAMLKVIGQRFAPLFSEEFTNEVLKRAARVAR